MQEAVLKEFLEGCIPDNAGGERKWAIWPRSIPNPIDKDEDMGDRAVRDNSQEGWKGTERIRRSTQMLTSCMRESSMI